MSNNKSGHVMNEEECLDHNSKEFIKLLNKYDKQIKYLSSLCDVLGFNETIKSDIMLARQGLFDAEMDLTYPNPDDEERDDIRKQNMLNMQTAVNNNLQVAMGMVNNMM